MQSFMANNLHILDGASFVGLVLVVAISSGWKKIMFSQRKKTLHALRSEVHHCIIYGKSFFSPVCKSASGEWRYASGVKRERSETLKRFA